MIVSIPRVVIDLGVRGMCAKPYPSHPKGCPNFGKKKGCPPSCLKLSEKLDLSKPLWAIVTEFDLGSHVERMREKHPEWTDRQLYCCLYWQPKARKNLKEEIRRFVSANPGQTVDTCPEAGGMNVTETLKLVGIELEWPPRKITRQVAVAGKEVHHGR